MEKARVATHWWDWYGDSIKQAKIIIAQAKVITVKVVRRFQNLDFFSNVYLFILRETYRK